MRKLVMTRKKNAMFKSCLFRKKMSLCLPENVKSKIYSFYFKNRWKYAFREG